MAFDAGELIAQLKLDRDPFQRSAKEAIAEGEALSKERFDMTVGLNQAPLDAGIAEAEAKAQSIGPVEVPVTVSDRMGPGMAAVEAQKAALSEPVTIPVNYDAQIRTVLSQGFSHQDTTDFLQFLGLGPKQAQSALTTYLERVAQQNAAERSSTLAQAMADAVMPTSDQFGRAYQDAFYRMIGAGGSRGATPTGWQFYRGPLALPAAGETSSGPFPNWSPAPESSYPGWGGLGAVLAAGGAGSGGGGGVLGAAGIGAGAGGGAGGSGFLGRAANLEEGRIYQAMGMGANAAGALALATPVLLSFASTLAVAAASMTALGIAAAPTALAIGQGVSAVNQANTALEQAVPGTTQWASALQGVSTAWAGINPQLQGSVQSILSLFSGHSALGSQVQGFVKGDVVSITSWLQGAMNHGTFSPLILAAEKAFNSIPGTFSKAMGWSSPGAGISQFVAFLARDTGPAIRSLTELAAQVVRIGAALAHLGEGGQGMALLVQAAKDLADILSSGAIMGFFRGFVAVDRAALSLLTTALRLVGVLGPLGHSAGTVQMGQVAGYGYGLYRLFRLTPFYRGGGASTAGGVSAEGAALGGGAAGGAAGSGATVGGIALADVVPPIVAGLLANAAAHRLHRWASAHTHGTLHDVFHPPPNATPDASALDIWNAAAKYVGGGTAAAIDNVLGLFGFHGDPLANPFGRPTAAQLASERNAAAWQSYNRYPVSTIGLTATANSIAYRDALQFGKLPGARAHLPPALAALLTSGEQIGGGLVGAVGSTAPFAALARAAAASYGQMVANLQAHNSRLQSWAQDAQKLLREGVNPGFVASVANTMPQDLATLADRSTAQIHRMVLMWEENLMMSRALAKAKGGILGLTTYITRQLFSTVPVIHQAAVQIGRALGLPIPGIISMWRYATNQIALLIQGTAAQATYLMSHAQSSMGERYMHGLGYRYGLSGHRAAGGPVSALSAYLVGEKGPEVFVPGQSGYIVPNQSFGRSSGGAPQVSVTFYIDATGATNPAATKQQVQQALDATWPKVRQAIKQGVGKIG